MSERLALPETIGDEAELEELLSRPTEALVESMARIEGDVIVLGVGGKMGPTLARMARRASDAAGVSRRVIGVSRFSTPGLEARLGDHGIETIRCDLLSHKQLNELPDAPNVVYMAGMKFGATDQEPLTWAMNVYLAGMVCERFRHSRIVAFSTGNVYGMVRAESGGSRESDPPRPEGDYAMSCLGRERIFDHFSRSLGIPAVLVRLNYANEMRYGVLVDVGQRVLGEEPVDVTMGYFNAIWQGDANAMILCLLEHATSPPRVLNVTGPERLRVREVAEQFGQLFGKRVEIRGEEAPDALLSNAERVYRLVGRPQVGPEQMTRWIADWLRRGGPTLSKPTHFEVRDGKF